MVGNQTDADPEVILPTQTVAPIQKQLRNTCQERKFNLVVFGIAECPQGTARTERAEMDE